MRTRALWAVMIALSGAGCADDEIATTPPQPVGPDFVLVSTGFEHTCALTDANDVFCWGGGGGGELGDFRAADSAVPVKTHGTTRFTDLSVGAQHACAVDTNGFVHCWGNNFRGQLGNATNISVGTPVPVTGSTRFAGVSSGSFHSCAFTASGAVFCWGAGTQGQLGTALAQDYTAPQRLPTALSFTRLAAGAYHTCALRADGTAYCWGANHHGQLGDGSYASGSAPRAVAGSLRFSAIAAGSTHTCAVALEGALYCWGGNADGELGRDPAVLRYAAQPLAVPISAAITDVAAGERTTCAVDVHGRAWCWGYGADGQLGDDRAVSRSQPRLIAQGRVFAGDSIRQVSTALAHTCAATALHSIYCWGSGHRGQLGTGVMNSARSAVPIVWSGP